MCMCRKNWNEITPSKVLTSLLNSQVSVSIRPGRRLVLLVSEAKERPLPYPAGVSRDSKRIVKANSNQYTFIQVIWNWFTLIQSDTSDTLERSWMVGNLYHSFSFQEKHIFLAYYMNVSAALRDAAKVAGTSARCIPSSLQIKKAIRSEGLCYFWRKLSSICLPSK